MGGGAWQVKALPSYLDNLSNARKNRYVKLHPDEFLSEEATGKKYDYTIYIDGKIRITCDIKPLVYSLIESGKTIATHMNPRNDIYAEAGMAFVHKDLPYKDVKAQMDFYKSKGMPECFGVTENAVIIRKCNDPEVNSLMEQWWEQIQRFTHRDQLSLPYVLWKNGVDISYIFSLGYNIWGSPFFIFHIHKKKHSKN